MDHLANAAALAQAQERLHELGVPRMSAIDKVDEEWTEAEKAFSDLEEALDTHTQKGTEHDTPEKVEASFNGIICNRPMMETAYYIDPDSGHSTLNKRKAKFVAPKENDKTLKKLKADGYVPDGCYLLFCYPKKEEREGGEWSKLLERKYQCLLGEIKKDPYAQGARHYILIHEGKTDMVKYGALNDLIRDCFKPW